MFKMRYNPFHKNIQGYGTTKRLIMMFSGTFKTFKRYLPRDWRPRDTMSTRPLYKSWMKSGGKVVFRAAA